MLGEVLLISCYQFLLDAIYLIIILAIQPLHYNSWHSTYYHILFQVIGKPLRKSPKVSISLVYIVNQHFLSISYQKFLERQGIEMQEVCFAYREGCSFVQGYTQQRTSTANNILGCLLAEIFQRSEGPRHFLHFIEDDESLLWLYDFAIINRELFYNTLR